MDPLSFSVYLKFFIGLTAIINPLGLLPVFVSLTSQQTPQERLRTNTTANFAVMVILWVSMFFGQIILDAFDISIASFRIAGGSLIVLIAWSMLQAMAQLFRIIMEITGMFRPYLFRLKTTLKDASASGPPALIKTM